jgi:phosphoglycerate dehydrogenase-like enzyme
MLARRIPEGLSSVAENRWAEGTAMLGSDIARKVLLVVGFGRIGQAVAGRALAAGMYVQYVDMRDDIPEVTGCTRVGSLAEGLRAADFVALHIDLNPGTRNLMDAEAFASMKPTAFFVNTSRGGVVDQTAMVDALTSGQIAGAGLDVLAHEPPDASDPILSAPNTIIVPHIGSATTETRAAMAQCAVDNLLMVLRGEKSPNELPG